jgi:hypothetical protein
MSTPRDSIIILALKYVISLPGGTFDAIDLSDAGGSAAGSPGILERD